MAYDIPTPYCYTASPVDLPFMVDLDDIPTPYCYTASPVDLPFMVDLDDIPTPYCYTASPVDLPFMVDLDVDLNLATHRAKSTVLCGKQSKHNLGHVSHVTGT